MEFFEQYLCSELEKFYARENLSGDDLEELYIRFSNLDDLPRTHPYLYAMRYMGWGTEAEPEDVMKELGKMLEMEPDNILLAGLQLDLQILSGKGNALTREKLKDAAAKGYSNIYLKNKSALAWSGR